MQTVYFPIQHLDKPAIAVSGLCYFFFTPVENVAVWPLIDPQSGVYITGIVLKEGKTWFRCEVIDADRDYREASKTDAAGPFIETALEGFLPDDSPTNALSFSAMQYHQYVIVLKERNNMMRMLGSEDAGVRFARTYESADADGTRGSKLVFSWQSPLPAALYLTAVTADGEVISPPWEGGGGAETDPTVPSWVKAITQQQIANWNAAFGWGNHAIAGYLTKVLADGYYAPINHTHTWASITDKPDDIDFQIDGPPINGVDSPTGGTSTYTNPALVGKTIRLFRMNGSKRTNIGFPLGDGYTQPNASGTISVVPAWEQFEIVSIEIVK
jgi:hypothetical protein